MISSVKLDFASLNQEFGGEPWCDTFAYWIGTSQPVIKAKAELEEIAEYMDYWYDMEEQAQDLGWLQDDHEFIPTPFHPIAPVTLANRWSPFPTAIKLLGQPSLFTSSSGRVAATFEPKLLTLPQITSVDEAHFLFLLNYACQHALDNNCQILLAGSPGWDYSEDFMAEDSKLKQIMQQFGFIFFGRKPVT